MNKDYYTLSEIILGLRDEYLKVSENLKKLEKYIVFNKNIVNKSNISIKCNEEDIISCFSIFGLRLF